MRDNFEQRHDGCEFQIFEGQKHETGRQFTTRETIAAELATIGHMQRGQNTVEPILPKEQATAHADTRDFLNPGQRGAIEEVLTIPAHSVGDNAHVQSTSKDNTDLGLSL